MIRWGRICIAFGGAVASGLFSLHALWTRDVQLGARGGYEHLTGWGALVYGVGQLLIGSMMAYWGVREIRGQN